MRVNFVYSRSLKVLPPPKSSGLPAFLRELLQLQAPLEPLHLVDAGGGGDCLFHAIAAGLEQALIFGGHDAFVHICRGSLLTLDDFNVTKDHLVQKLRTAVSQRFISLDAASLSSPEDFLNWLLARVEAKRRGAGWWHDAWNPIELVEMSPFQPMLRAERVDGFGDAPGTDDKFLNLRFASTDASLRAEPWNEFFRISDGAAYFATLQVAVADVYATTRNVHWGDQTDLAFLSEQLQVGFLVFTRDAQDPLTGRRWLAGYNVARHDYPYWLALYNSGNTHYQILSLRTHDGPEVRPYTCFWRAEDLPQALRDHYHLCTGSQIGDGPTGGIN